MKPENLKKLEDTIKAMDSMYENQLKPYISISQQVGEAASFLVDRMNELIAIYNDEGGEKWFHDFSIMQDEHHFVEPAYNGSYCENYIKISE